MPEQLSFDLPVRVAHGRESFFVSDANALAVAMLDASQNWPQRKMIVQGSTGSGKSHLLDIWRADTGAVDWKIVSDGALPDAGSNITVDNIDALAGDIEAETHLFHLHNHLAATGGMLLMATTRPVTQAGFTLPDLLSRLQGTQVVRIDPPDDDLLGAVVLKSFMDRQLSPTPAVQSYILKHMDRSFAAARQIVADLDHQSMSQKRPITRAMASEILHRT